MPFKYERKTVFYGQPMDRVALVTGDINNDGNDEILVAGRIPEMGLHWYEPDGDGQWKQHLIDDDFHRIEAGGVLFDVDGDGRLDFIAGGDWKGDRLCWWQCPENPRQPWKRRLIHHMEANASHDQIVADIDGDGRPELYFWNQHANKLKVVPVPDDPTIEPWPNVADVATDVKGGEGFAIADVDGDGKPELIAGQAYYKYLGPGNYEEIPFTVGYASPRLAAGDFLGSGTTQIVLAEGDASMARPRYENGERAFGRLVLFQPPATKNELWTPTLLHDHLEDPHSLFAHDFDGDGRPEIFVGELGNPNGKARHPEAQRIYDFVDGEPVEHIIDYNLGTHEAKLLRFQGQDCIAGKPYRNHDKPRHGNPEVDAIHIWCPVDA